MKYNTLEKYFSFPRLQKYLNHFSGDRDKAFRLYRANLRLSQAFYPLLSILEISLRNSIDTHFGAFFSDPAWLITQSSPKGFMNDGKLNIKTNPFYMRNNINRASKKLGAAFSHGKLISELSFGFWTEFFDRSHYKILKGESIHIFPNLPPSVKRNNIYSKLNSIRVFRNRIYHYEPICFSNGTLSYANTKKIYDDIFEVYSWFDKDLVRWSSFHDFVPYELLHIRNCSNNNYIKYITTTLKLKTLFTIIKIYHSLRSDKLT